MAVKKLQLDFTQKIRALNVRAKRNIISKVLQGSMASLIKGRGLEFTDYRVYSPTDDASRIDWKASLRSRDVLIKEYEEEKALNMYFLFDVSNSMLFSSHRKLKCEYAAEMIAAMAYSASKGGNGVGLVMFADDIVEKVNISSGRRSYPRIIRSLSNPEFYGGNFNMNKGLKFCMNFIKERSVLVIVSDFIGLDENWITYVKIASQRFDIMAMIIRDPRDDFLPPLGGQFMVQDPFSDEKLYVDTDDYADLYNADVMHEKEKLMRLFHLTKSTSLFLNTKEDFAIPLSKFFQKRLKALGGER